jgi:acetylornithine deacetylase/succinyl-diaminopimelate desuccinylase-like protein
MTPDRPDIDADALVDLTAELVAAPTQSPPGEEGAVAAFLAERLRESPVDFEVTVEEVLPDRPNVVARAGDPERGSALLTGHTDVVPAVAEDWTGDPFELRRDGDRVVGRGVADMKGALAAKLLAAESYLEGTERPGEVVLGFVVNEESGGDGTQALVESGAVDGVDAAVIGEPTDLEPAICQFGGARWEVTVHGRSAHSGRPDRGANAILGMRRVLERLEELDREVRRDDHPLLEPGPSISVTELESGIAGNVIPDRATATVACRCLPEETERQERYIHGLGDRLPDDVTVAGETLRVKAEARYLSYGVGIDPDEPAVGAVGDAARDVGLAGEPVGFNAGTDSRFLIPEGIPTVLFGPGTIEDDAHTVDESVAVDDLVTTAAVYRGTLERLLED